MGIAQGLVKESEQWVSGKKCIEFAVDTDPTEYNSMDFYLSYGFIEIKREDDEVLFKKAIKSG